MPTLSQTRDFCLFVMPTHIFRNGLVYFRMGITIQFSMGSRFRTMVLNSHISVVFLKGTHNYFDILLGRCGIYDLFFLEVVQYTNNKLSTLILAIGVPHETTNNLVCIWWQSSLTALLVVPSIRSWLLHLPKIAFRSPTNQLSSLNLWRTTLLWYCDVL